MQINFGCGRHVLDGWFNIDVAISPNAKRSPELLFEARFKGQQLIDQVPLSDDCADELMAIHFFEHLYLWQTDAMVTEWRRLLKVGGLLALELPNIVKCCNNIVKGIGIEAGGKNPHALGLWGLYGDPRAQDPYMNHKWGWSPKTLTDFLTTHGFIKIREEVTQWHAGGRANRDMRIVSIKA